MKPVLHFAPALLVCLSACTSALAEPVWRIVRNDHVAYVVGTTHLAPEGRPKLSPLIESLVRSEANIYFELEPGAQASPPTPGGSQTSHQGFGLPERAHASEVLKSARTYFRHCYGENLPNLLSLQPWVWVVDCDSRWAQSVGMSKAFGTESLVLELVRPLREEPRVLGVETLADQILALTEISPASWLEFIKEARGGRDRSALRELFSDSSSLVAQTESEVSRQIYDDWYSTQGRRNVSQHLIEARNERFFAAVNHGLSIHKLAVYFLGVSHTVGPAGVIERLRTHANLQISFLAPHEQAVRP